MGPEPLPAVGAPDSESANRNAWRSGIAEQGERAAFERIGADGKGQIRQGFRTHLPRKTRLVLGMGDGREFRGINFGERRRVLPGRWFGAFKTDKSALRT